MKKEGLTKQQKKAQTHGLLPFGGGKHLCPGRHLAFTDIVSFVAPVVYGFEVRMKDSGLVKLPPYKTAQLGENSKKPAHDLEVLIRRRDEFKGVIRGSSVDPLWTWRKSGPKKRRRCAFLFANLPPRG
jgi:hypothetical protein